MYSRGSPSSFINNTTSSGTHIYLYIANEMIHDRNTSPAVMTGAGERSKLFSNPGARTRPVITLAPHSPPTDGYSRSRSNDQTSERKKTYLIKALPSENMSSRRA